jgi:nucleoside-diphosphate-sugar epimerase
MKIHVTGATGFIGRHFIAQAQRAGHQVVALVRTVTDELADITQLEIGDLAERTDWEALVSGADCVVHLAARVHVMNEKDSGLAELYERHNTVPTLRLARAAADAGVGRFVFASSIKVNGEKTTGEPFSANSAPAPVDAYGRSKHRAEQLLRELADNSTLAISIVRPTVVYGAGVGGNIARIAGAVSRKLPLPLGSAHNSRSMLGVENLVVGLLAAATASHPGSQTYLLADPEPISTRKLIELLAEGLGVAPPLLSFPRGLLRFGAGILGRAADIDRLFEDLVVVPDWSALGVSADQIVATDEGIRAYARSLAASRTR